MKNIISTDRLSEDKEIVLLISSIERLKAKINIENDKINSCIHILEQENKNYCTYLHDLEIEIVVIRNGLNLNTVEKEDIEDIIDTNIREELKSLYRKISIKCHPDKTKDIELHEVFKQAKKAYSNLDYSELKKIYESIYGEDDNIGAAESKINSLRKQLKKIESDYLNLTKKHTYLMMKMYESGDNFNKMKSKKIFLDLVFTKIFELEELKSKLILGA